jgi:hypothetical protein
MPNSRAAPEKLRALATFANTVMLVSRSTFTIHFNFAPRRGSTEEHSIIHLLNKLFKLSSIDR